MRNVCVDDKSGLTLTGRDCVLVECEGDADCCAGFVPDSSCELLEADCAADAASCFAYRSLCVCNRGCESDQCIALGVSCASDDECPASLPRCSDGRCRECAEHGDCFLDAQRCVDGSCDVGCQRDEECPALHACTNGACEEAPCTSDRECAFVLGTELGRCVEGRCEVGCAIDADCDEARFEVCDDGRCAFVGCETDAECRAFLGVSEQPGVRAECR